MRVLRSISLPKEADYAASNDDVFFAAPGGLAVAMSDGASESYDSRGWGRMLCETFNAQFECGGDQPLEDDAVRTMVVTARRRFLASFEDKPLSWSQQASFDRGNFASLLGLYEGPSLLTLLAIGDSIAVWRETGGAIRSHALTDPEEFKRHPVLLSSDARGDAVVFERERARWSAIQIPKAKVAGGRIYLMTDAIGAVITSAIQAGRWPEAERQLCQSELDFKYWVSQQRMARVMRPDDTTLAVITTR